MIEEDDTALRRLHVIVNWFEEPERLVPSEEAMAIEAGARLTIPPDK